VAPGQFQESAGGKRVFFIDKDTPDNKTGTNVFVSSLEGRVESITSARQGLIQLKNGENVLSLKNGQQILRDLDTGDIRVIDFQQYEVVIDPNVKAIASNAPSMTSSLDLIRDPRAQHLGELAWRLGLGLAALNLVLLALAVATANPRVGRSYHTALALLIFIVYYNMINVGQSWIGLNRVSFSGFLLGLHGSVFVVALTWIAARHFNWSWRHLFKRSALPVRVTP